MSKPWDHLRKPVKTPIGSGEWMTSDNHAAVSASVTDRRVVLAIGSEAQPCSQAFWKNDLTELIEFLTELRDQIQ